MNCVCRQKWVETMKREDSVLNLLQLGIVAAFLLAGLSSASADPGPNCALTTPTDKAQCGTVTMAIGGAYHQP